MSFQSLPDTQASGAPALGADALADLRQRVAALNARYRHHGAVAVLEGALRDPEAGDIAMVSSFGAESIALLHLVAMIDRKTPVLFIDTRLLFAETLVYQQDVAERLHLEDVRVIRTDEALLAERDPNDDLRNQSTDACCALRKTVPLEQALAGFDGWITGRKRFQSATRQTLEFFELEDATGRIKVNPLAHWAPEDVRVIRTDEALLAQRDPDDDLRNHSTDACCALRKTVPLEQALSGFDGWITGRKRFQSATRQTLEFFELEDATGRIKVNPLAHWAPEDVRAYMDENRLPRHPLVAQGYPSIGCAPCTSPVAEGEDPRSGRWRGEEKVECGIHFANGRMVRQGPST